MVDSPIIDRKPSRFLRPLNMTLGNPPACSACPWLDITTARDRRAQNVTSVPTAPRTSPATTTLRAIFSPTVRRNPTSAQHVKRASAGCTTSSVIPNFTPVKGRTPAPNAAASLRAGMPWRGTTRAKVAVLGDAPALVSTRMETSTEVTTAWMGCSIMEMVRRIRWTKMDLKAVGSVSRAERDVKAHQRRIINIRARTLRLLAAPWATASVQCTPPDPVLPQPRGTNLAIRAPKL